MYGKERSNNMIGDIRKFKFWCQKVLPLVYDDSLSYYEILCKVVQYLNKVIEDVNTIPEYIDGVIMEHLSDEHLKELIFEVVEGIQEALSSNNEGTNTNSSKDYKVGQMLWLNGVLYKVIRDIDTGDTFVIDTNIEAVTFEELFNSFVEEVKDDITKNDEGYSSTATQNWSVGNWLWLGDALYEVTRDIVEGNAFVFEGDNANVVKLSIEEDSLFIKELIANLTAIVGNLDTLTTSDKTSIVNAINSIINERGDLADLTTDDKTSIVNAINSIVNERGDLADLTTDDKTSIVNAINEVNETGGGSKAIIGDLSELTTDDKSTIVGAINEVNAGVSRVENRIDFITPEDFGAVGDGVTDDSDALIACFSSNELNEKYIKLRGTYKLTKRVVVQSNTCVRGGGIGTILDQFDTTGQTTFLTRATFAMHMIENVIFDGIIVRGTGAVSQYTLKYMFLMQNCSHIYFKNCKMYDYPGVGVIYPRDCENIWVTHCLIQDYSRGAITFCEGTSNSGVLFSEISNGHETNTPNRYPLMLNGYDQIYDADNMGKQGYRLFAIGNYIHDENPWWEGIDAHGGSHLFVAYNRIVNTAVGISIFTNINRGFAAYEVHVHDNDVYTTLEPTSNSSTHYGNAFGGSRMFINHNRFRNGGRSYPDDAGACVYFDRGYNVHFNDNVVQNGYGCALFFSGEFNEFHIHHNEISHPANSGSNAAMIKFNQSSVTLYSMTIEDNYFTGIDKIVIAPAGKTTTNQYIRLKDNNYALTPTFTNLAYIQPDRATVAQIAISTCGQNGDICWNVNPAVGEPIGWIMTNSTHYTGTWRALPNLT